MNRPAAFGTIGTLLLCVTGCSGPDALVKEFIANLNLYAETLEKREPKEKQQAALERVRSTIERIDRLKLSPEDRTKLLARHDAEFKRAKERLEEAQKAVVMEGGDAPDPLVNFKK